MSMLAFCLGTGGDNVTQSLHMLARLRYRKLRGKLGASPETDFISDCVGPYLISH